MLLSLRDVARIARAMVARSWAERVEVVGVARAETDSAYAELLLTVKPDGAADRRGKRTVLVQVRRTDAATVESDLQRRLTRALRARPTEA